VGREGRQEKSVVKKTLTFAVWFSFPVELNGRETSCWGARKLKPTAFVGRRKLRDKESAERRRTFREEKQIGENAPWMKAAPRWRDPKQEPGGGNEMWRNPGQKKRGGAKTSRGPTGDRKTKGGTCPFQAWTLSREGGWNSRWTPVHWRYALRDTNISGKR